jgi:hypothetical protein
MMDSRRLDTAGVLASGIINMPAPKTDIPHDREEIAGSSDYDNPLSEAELIAALDADKLIVSANYYGIPYVWREAEGRYHGRLLQYRNVTESPFFITAVEASEWFRDKFWSTYG